MKLSDKVAIVTGAARGIGRACAERMLAEGAKVMIADVDQDHLRTTSSEIGQEANVLPIVADIRSKEAVEALAARAVEHFGRLNIMVNNAGMNQVTSTAAVAFAPHNIRVVGVGPGTIDTEMARGDFVFDATDRAILARTPLGRYGTAAEIAAVVAFLASDDAPYLTGETIYPEGGRRVLNYVMPEKV